jgi:hypothetical protein
LRFGKQNHRLVAWLGAICDKKGMGSTPRARAASPVALAPYAARWLADVLQPYLGRQILHFDAEMGDLAKHLRAPHAYTARVRRSEAVVALQKCRAGRPHATVECHDPMVSRQAQAPPGRFDTILWLHTGPWFASDQATLAWLRHDLAPHGRMVLVQVPSVQGVGTQQDQHVAPDAETLARAAQLVLRQQRDVARLETPVRRVLQAWRNVGGMMPDAWPRLGGKLRPLACRFDALLPWSGAYCILVLTHPPAMVEATCDGPDGRLVLRPKPSRMREKG